MARGTAEIAADNAAVVARLSAVLADSHFTAMVLLSEHDGTKTAAAAIMLASCSPVFLKMLTGSFAEGAARGRKKSSTSLDTDTSAALLPSELTVSCAFTSQALAAVVAFAATNDAPALWSGSAELVSEILEASEYYDIDGLRLKAKRRLVAHATEVPAEACEVLQAVWERWATDEFGACEAGEVAEAALAVMGNGGAADVALMGCGCLCEEAMKKVLGGRRICANEEDLFSALQMWLAVDEEARRAAGGRLASSLSFERMSPSFLTDSVAKSGLVSKEELFDIFQGQALKAEFEHGFDSSSRYISPLPNWCSTGTVEYTGKDGFFEVELLDLSLDSGCWAWDILVEKTSKLFAVGLVSSGFDPKHRYEWLGNQKCEYAYARSGIVSRPDCVSRKLPSFKQGDTIHVSFDCDTGALSFGVNDGEPREAFTGILQAGEVNSFTPAVSFTYPGRARLLKFNRVIR